MNGGKYFSFGQVNVHIILEFDLRHTSCFKNIAEYIAATQAQEEENGVSSE